MSQTIGDSKNQPTKDNIHLAGAQIVPTENELEIPPRSYRRGLTVVEASKGEVIEIKARDSYLREDGKLVAEGKNAEGKPSKVLVANFSASDFDKVKSNKKTRAKLSREQEVR